MEFVAFFAVVLVVLVQTAVFVDDLLPASF
jgi:hypothetical protein